MIEGEGVAQRRGGRSSAGRQQCGTGAQIVHALRRRQHFDGGRRQTHGGRWRCGCAGTVGGGGGRRQCQCDWCFRSRRQLGQIGTGEAEQFDAIAERVRVPIATGGCSSGGYSCGRLGETTTAVLAQMQLVQDGARDAAAMLERVCVRIRVRALEFDLLIGEGA